MVNATGTYAEWLEWTDAIDTEPGPHPTYLLSDGDLLPSNIPVGLGTTSLALHSRLDVFVAMRLAIGSARRQASAERAQRGIVMRACHHAEGG
jgi:hypothetical protein